MFNPCHATVHADSPPSSLKEYFSCCSEFLPLVPPTMPSCWSANHAVLPYSLSHHVCRPTVHGHTSAVRTDSLPRCSHLLILPCTPPMLYTTSTTSTTSTTYDDSQQWWMWPARTWGRSPCCRRPVTAVCTPSGCERRRHTVDDAACAHSRRLPAV